MPNTLHAIAFDQLSAYLNDKGSPLQGQHKDALKAFMETLEDGLRSKLEAKYYLLSLDPGMGKTRACVEFIRAWREQGYQPNSSILIGVSTLDELKSFITASGLPSDEFGVLTGNPEMNAMGLSSNLHDQARVLFTTQQMIRSRTKGRSFDDASKFHYNGQPRALRLWDESLLPRDGVIIRRDDLLGLMSPLRPDFPDYVERLEALCRTIETSTEGASVVIDELLYLNHAQQRFAKPLLSSGEQDVIAQLQLVSGSSLRTVQDERYGSVLIGVTPTLPEDFAPVIILDASGRVRETYEEWSRHEGNLERLVSARNCYHKLNVHVWKRSSGTDALNDPDTRTEIALAMGTLFERDPEGQWLIVTYKGAKDGLELAVERNKPANVNPKLTYIHWGIHHSTNAHRDIDNVIVVGQFTYRSLDYLGLVLASSGLPDPSNAMPDTRAMKVGEYQHNLLQAVCRASVRKASEGVTDRCNLFLITSQPRIEEVLETTFPGCSVTEWRGGGQLNGHMFEATRFIRSCLIVGNQESISKASIKDHLGISSQSLSGNVLRKPEFERFIRSNGLEMTTRSIRRVASGFEAIAGGYIADPIA
jgi:hypothetical protein